jgi:hypothetical protein
MQSKHEIDDALRAVKLHDGFWSRLVRAEPRHATLPHVWRQVRERRPPAQPRHRSRGVRRRSTKAGPTAIPTCTRSWKAPRTVRPDALPDAAWDAKMDAVIAQVRRSAGAGRIPRVLHHFARSPTNATQDMARSHELYCMGHMLEAAVEHFQATGKRSYLEIAMRAADHMDATFGPGKLRDHVRPPGSRVGAGQAAPGHRRAAVLGPCAPVLRGHARRPGAGGSRVQRAAHRRGRPTTRAATARRSIGRTIEPILRAALRDRSRRPRRVPVCGDGRPDDGLWRAGVCRDAGSGDLGRHRQAASCTSPAAWARTSTAMKGSAIPYLLPNDSGYCETCGGIALLLFSHRMGLLTGDAKYADLVETDPLQQHARLHRPRRA